MHLGFVLLFQAAPGYTGISCCQDRLTEGGLSMGRFECASCGCIYDEEEGDPSQGIYPDTPFEELPDDWVCAECGSPSDGFEETDE